MKRLFPAAPIAALSCLAACGPVDEPTASDPTTTPVVYVTFEPTAYMAERIAAGRIPVENPCPLDADPATWRPAPDVIAAYQSARLIAINGAGFERWVAMAALPRSRVVDTSSGLASELIEYETVTHSHGPGGEHAHAGVNGHTWLDPNNAMRQATSLRDAMRAAFPEHADAFTHGHAELEADLRRLDASLAAIDLDGVQILANHPSYDYLARRYGWSLVTLDLDPAADADDGVDQLRTALDGADASRLIMLWESQPNDALEDAISAFGVRIVVFEPGESARTDMDYLTVMQRNVERLGRAAEDD